MKQSAKLIFLFGISILYLSFISAVPQLIINSPENITYDTTKVFINVTSNEPVDFYTKSPMTNTLVKINSTFYESALYGKTGNFNFTIYANNSNGMTSKSIFFSINASNPINITSCGQLISPNAYYQVMNNLFGSEGCLDWTEATNNISLNLNGFTVEASGYSPIISVCFFSEIFNGTINYTGSSLYEVLDVWGDSCLFKNLIIEGPAKGIRVQAGFKKGVFENVSITAPIGLHIDTGSVDISFKKVNFLGSRTGIGDTVFYHDGSQFDYIVLEEVNFINYTRHIEINANFQMEYIMRNSNLNFSNIELAYGIARFLTQHLIRINITNETGNPISGAIEIVQSGFNITNPPTIEKIDSNPTAHIFTATNELGIAEVFLTEEASIKRAFSPSEIIVTRFNSYILTARSAGVSNNTLLDFGEINSTIEVNIPLAIRGALPECTLQQMLDLNSDGNVNILDATIILRYIAGLPVSSTGIKECTGINLNAF